MYCSLMGLLLVNLNLGDLPPKSGLFKAQFGTDSPEAQMTRVEVRFA